MRVYIRVLLFIALLGTAVSFAQSDTTFRAQGVVVRHDGKHADNSNIVAWLTPLPPATATVTPGRFRLVQKNKQFEPHLLVIPVGSMVDFPNQDPFFHNVFSLYKGKRFDLGLYEAGSSRAVHFDRPGVSFIFCNIHPQMIAVILTMSTPYYAVSNATGEIAIKDVPAGRYRLDVWDERAAPEALQALSREVVLPQDSSALTLRVAEVVEGPVPHKNKYGKDYDTAQPYQR